MSNLHIAPRSERLNATLLQTLELGIMKLLFMVAVILAVFGLTSCSSYQPHHITQEELSSGNPPLTGVLPNGVMEDNATK